MHTSITQQKHDQEKIVQLANQTDSTTTYVLYLLASVHLGMKEYSNFSAVGHLNSTRHHRSVVAH